MKKRMVRVLTSAALTAAMVMSMGMTAFAGVESIDIKKTVETDGKTYAPNTTFTFSVAPAKEDGTFTADGKSISYYGGIPGGLVVNSEKAVAEYDPETMGILGATNKTVTADGALEVYVDHFAKAKTGVYKYVVSETAGSYDGITYDTATYDVYLYVTEGTGETAREINTVVVTKNGEVINVTGNAGKAADIAFTNDYGKDYDKTHDLTITKKVTGTLGEHNRPFEIGVTVTGADGEMYNVVSVKKDSEGEEIEETIAALTSGKKGTYSLKDGESIRIYGLSESDEYVVEENEKYQDEGYDVTYSDEDGDGKGKVTSDATVLTITNDKDAVTPTGIVMTFAPYIALIALAGVFAVTFLRKRREEF